MAHLQSGAGVLLLLGTCAMPDVYLIDNGDTHYQHTSNSISSAVLIISSHNIIGSGNWKFTFT